MPTSRPMRRRGRRLGGVAALLLVVLLGLASVAAANHSQPAPDITKMDYTPIGKFGPAGQNVLVAGETPSPTIPATTAAFPGTGGTYPASIFNPSGKWVAYDSDVFVSINYPDRHPDDPAENTESDPAKDIPAGGSVTYGTCPPRPGFGPWGDCGNHAREYREYFEATMKEILGEFGVQIKRYPFHSPGTGTPRGQFISGSEGDAMNIMAVVPGTDHPDESVLVSGHYDFTDSGPAAAWDSSEGHQEVIRMAAIMADYWRKTGTRPSATVKFAPWDSEESGTFGSIDYVANNIPPGEEDKIRGYFNVDPCSGAYPAARRGVGDRVPEVLQLADPTSATDEAIATRMDTFNKRAETILDEVLDNLDDTVGGTKVFISDAEAEAGEGDSQRGEFVTALGGLAAFSSDYANFEGIGVPIFNLFPDYFGPHADGTPASAEGVSILHTNNDNMRTLNGLTSPDQSGTTASEGWAKGMEMCAQMNSWYMLQPEMGGAQSVAPDRNPIVAYFEALPNEVAVGDKVKFDANGSYQYANVAGRSYVPDSQLSYSWDFGDGSSGSGKTPEHSYAATGKYQAKLTVSNGNQSSTMELPITVEPSNLQSPVLEAVAPAEGADGTFPLKWAFEGETEGLEKFEVEESKNFRRLLTDGAEGKIEDNWVVAGGGDGLEPWQKSDSSTPKFRGNVTRTGEASFWAGVSPNNVGVPLQCGPGPVGPCDVETTMTLKTPIEVPPEDPELTLYSDFSNEGDDRGYIEAALVPVAGAEPDWEIVDDPIGNRAPDFYDPSDPSTFDTQWEFRRVDLKRFQGKQILIRFRLLMGDANRAASQPAGWYIDDVSVTSGIFSKIGETPASQKTFTVSGRPNGNYGYRVRGIYTGAVATGTSNPEPVAVTGGPPAPPTTGGPGTTARARTRTTSSGSCRRVRVRGRRAVRCVISGRVRLRTGNARPSCSGTGTVRVKIKTKTISSRRARVRSNCRWRVTVTFRGRRARARRFRLQVRFAGNRTLFPSSARIRTVRVR